MPLSTPRPAEPRRATLRNGTPVTLSPGYPEGYPHADDAPDRILARAPHRHDALRLVGAARLAPTGNAAVSRVHLEVDAPLRCLGLGTLLLESLIPHAHARGVRALVVESAPENHALNRCCLNAGFALHRDDDAGRVLAWLNLADAP